MLKAVSLLLVCLLLASGVTAQPDKKGRRNYDKAIQAYQDGDCKKTLKLLQKALKSAPNWVDALYLGGVCSVLRAQLIDAENYFSRAVASDPSHTSSQEWLQLLPSVGPLLPVATQLLKMEVPAAAQAFAELDVDAEPARYRALSMLIEIRTKSDIHNSNLHQILLSGLIKQKRWPVAERWVEMWREVDPGRALKIDSYLGQIFVLSGQVDQGRVIYENLVRHLGDPDFVWQGIQGDFWDYFGGTVENPNQISGSLPAYPQELIGSRILKNEVVILEGTITPQGRLIDLRVLNQPDYDLFIDAALEAVAEWRFEPGRINGKVVAYRGVIEVSFAIQ